LHQLYENIDWQQEEVKLFGRCYKLARQVAWLADDQALTYRYAGTTKIPQTWPALLAPIRQKLQSHLKCAFNACLLNYYADGLQAMGWHSDDESTLEAGAAIASLSLGAARPFDLRLRQNPQQKLRLWLESGSLLVMQGKTQHYWQHRLPPRPSLKAPRLNLTFRVMVTGKNL
jgi:alkylated DNA repair dioxygenase AlkB